jgi:S-DNA-T family DNA segregation ATPase FtsK/SpoIIIE
LAKRGKTGGAYAKRGKAPAGRGFSEVAILLLLLLSVLIVIGFFVKDASVLKIMRNGISSLLGAGLFVVPLVMLIIALYLILTLKSRKNKKWIISAALVPVFAGAIAHIFTAPARYISAESLMADGPLYKSGGLLAGGIAELMIKALSKPGAGIVLFVMLALDMLVFFNTPLSSVFSYISAKLEKTRENAAARRALAREEREYLRAEEERMRAQELSETPAAARNRPNINIPLENRRSSIDIPLDGYAPEPVGKFSLPGRAVYPAAPDVKKPEKPRVSMSPEEMEREISKIEREASASLTPEYSCPPISLLKKEPPANQESVEAEIRANAGKLIATLTSFNIEAYIVNITRGPTVTRYELQLGSGIKTSRLTALSDDIALALAAQSVRIANIPDKSAVGIEVPNKVVSVVYLRDVIESREFQESRSKVTFALGKDIGGKPIVSDIARLPHLLVGGTTNSGKSVCINSILISLLYKATPDDLRLILIDPKMVEFISYNGIPHLLIPVVTDAKKAAGALQWAVMEMMNRYKRFNELGVRNFTDYNNEVEKRTKRSGAFCEDESEPELEKMARIVIVIDELADLMLACPAEVEESICRIAQMARAAGMHLIVATQRPSADIITGLMKANIPSRIAFSVASSLESRIILDQVGAEKLLGRGDMLFNPIGANKPIRIQGCLVSSSEIEAVMEYIKNGCSPIYDDEVMNQIDKNAVSAGKGKSKGLDDETEHGAEYDELFDEAVEIVLEAGQASTSMLQRRLKLGFTRAARIVDQMEECGIVGASEGSKPRQLLITKDEWAEMKYRKSM